MAKTTAIASGVNRYLAVPVSSNTGTNTMQIATVATKVGTAICEAPSAQRYADLAAMLRRAGKPAEAEKALAEARRQGLIAPGPR